MKFRVLAAVAVFGGAFCSAFGQLRIATYNVTNYNGGRIAEFQTIFYETYQGRQFAPDVLLGQEFISQSAVNTFLNLLNTAPGSPGDWAAAPFIDGPDTDSAFFYRVTKVQYLGTTIAALGSTNTSDQPRNTYRYDFRPVGYTADSTTIAGYSVHLKSGSASTDQSRRLIETQRIRTNAEGLNPQWNFLIAGDLNIQASTQSAYQEMVGSQTNNAGRVFDPIKSPGNWNNTATYKYIHTQDPQSGSGGMDDRFDQILLSAGLVDGTGMDYIGNPNATFSTSTWNDPNHSYRCWGNDGTSFNTGLNTTTNSMVSSSIANALVSTAAPTGHLPVYLDMRVPPAIVSTQTIDFGIVPQGAVASKSFFVANSGNTAIWTPAGIATLTYTMSASGPFTVPSGSFSDSAGGNLNNHTVTLDTSTPGIKLGTISIASNAPDQPVRTITVRARVFGKINP